MKTSTLPSCVALTFPASTSHDFYLKRSEQLVIPYARRILLLLGFLQPPIMDWAFSVEKKKQNKKADGSPRRRYVSHSLFNRADSCGEGTGISGCLTNRFGSRFGTSTKLFRRVIGPISTPNDYLNAVFYDIISLCGSCRNNALPRSPREKLQLVAILLPACDTSFLTIKEYAICRSPHHTGTYSLAMDSQKGFKCNIRQK